MGLYTLKSLLDQGLPHSVFIFEREPQAGVGMPYRDQDNSRLMLANIASLEIPPLRCTYLDWLRTRPAEALRRFGIDPATLHERQFLPRILLGQYFRDQFLALLAEAKARGIEVRVHESTEVADIEAGPAGVGLWVAGRRLPHDFDAVLLATGHVWPQDDGRERHFFPSPWSGLLEARLPAAGIGIMGTSLSAIDAAMAVAARHGRFVADEADGQTRFVPDRTAVTLKITLMSRSGLLPEADFYCPMPYLPLQLATEEAIALAIKAGRKGLLDRVFGLIRQELQLADPEWCRQIKLADLDADSFAEAYFADRLARDPFSWAMHNLAEVERNQQQRHTVPWRYVILRLHEAVEVIVAELDVDDRERFAQGLSKVFVDNYAAVPPESIRRLLALRDAGVVSVLRLGPDYGIHIGPDHTWLDVGGIRHGFDVFIDARGQRPRQIRDLPFPRLRRQLQASGEDYPTVDEDYSLAATVSACARIACGALPYLMHDRPFVQGLVAAADIAAAMARLPWREGSPRRRRPLRGVAD